MAYQKKNWKDRQTEHPARRKLTGTTAGAIPTIYEVERDEGLIIDEGDALNAAGLNNLEGRIEGGFNDATTQFNNLATVATHAKSGTVHTLTLSKAAAAGIQMVQFKATADYTEGNTWKVGAVVYTAKLQGEDGAVPDKYFVVGDMVSVLLDPVGKKLGFKSGGGGAKLNVFCQLTEPTAPDGVWVKMADKPIDIKVLTYDDITVAGTWITRANPPSPVAWVGVANVSQILYVIGRTVSPTNQAYDTLSNTWSIKSNMINGRDGLIAEPVGTTIYAIGGTSSSANQAYDTLSDTWSTKAKMLASYTRVASDVVAGTIYIIGSSDNTFLNLAYDTLSNTWSTKTSKPTVGWGGAVVAVSTTIYVSGGRNDRDGYANNQAYDTLSNTWSTKTPKPTASGGLDGAARGTIIYAISGFVFGDTSRTIFTAANQAYDTLSNTWSTKVNIPTAREGHKVAAIANKLYTVGGTVTNEVYDICGTPYPHGTLAIQNLGVQGTKTKLISDRKVEIYTYVKQPVYYVDGQQIYPESYANYDNTGWQPIN